MELEKKFEQYIFSNHLFTKKDKLLVAVSGGMDSVVLVHLLHNAGFDFSIAHCNFQLRGDDSVRDEQFVKQLAAQLGKKEYTIQFNTKAFCKLQGVATQEGARMLRYQWFQDITQQNNYDYIVTAHHANDNVETVIMNFFRGTGLKGLKGIHLKNGKIVRPLLFATRLEIHNYLQKSELGFVHDISNDSVDYTRNYIRNELLPQLQNIYPQVQNNLLNNIDRFNDIYFLYQKELNHQLKKWIEYKDNEIWISVLKIKKTIGCNSILHELIQQYNFTAHQLDEVLKLLEAPTGKYIESATHRILKNRNHIVIGTIEERNSTITVINKPGNYLFSEGSISVTQSDKVEMNTQAHIACVDAAAIEFPMILRRWKVGDYFYPLGMDRKKKLARFFIDNKLSKFEKDRVWVLESNKKIIWIIGYRIDNRCKVQNHTQKTLKIEFLSAPDSL